MCRIPGVQARLPPATCQPARRWHRQVENPRGCATGGRWDWRRWHPGTVLPAGRGHSPACQLQARPQETPHRVPGRPPRLTAYLLPQEVGAQRGKVHGTTSHLRVCAALGLGISSSAAAAATAAGGARRQGAGGLQAARTLTWHSDFPCLRMHAAVCLQVAKRLRHWQAAVAALYRGLAVGWHEQLLLIQLNWCGAMGSLTRVAERDPYDGAAVGPRPSRENAGRPS